MNHQLTLPGMHAAWDTHCHLMRSKEEIDRKLQLRLRTEMDIGIDHALDDYVQSCLQWAGATNWVGGYNDRLGEWEFLFTTLKAPMNFLIDLAEYWNTRQEFNELRTTLNAVWVDSRDVVRETEPIATDVDLSALVYGM